ncbi:reverse transcriptase domain-containing protein [Tanacetum coccineum]
MDSNFNNKNEPWEFSLDIDDSDLQLTPVVRSSTSNPFRIIPGPAGLVQRAKLLKDNVFILDPDGALMSTQEYMQKVVEDVGEDADFNSGAWVSATNYVNAFGGTVTGCLGDIDNLLKKGKLEQVVAIVKSCSPNALGDLNVTLKDLSGTVPGTINYKVLDVGGYGKDITVGAAMILANVSVFTPKPSKHYLNITKRNVVESIGDEEVKEAMGSVVRHLYKLLHEVLSLWKELWRNNVLCNKVYVDIDLDILCCLACLYEDRIAIDRLRELVYFSYSPPLTEISSRDLVDSYSDIDVVPGQMTHLVASSTLDSANSCVMQGTSCTQRKISMVLFVLPSIMLLVVIVVTVVIVVVILVVVFVVIVEVIVVVIVPLDSVFLLVLSVFAMLAACASKAAATLSATSFRMVARVMDGVLDVDVLLGGIYQHIQDNTE